MISASNITAFMNVCNLLLVLLQCWDEEEGEDDEEGGHQLEDLEIQEAGTEESLFTETACDEHEENQVATKTCKESRPKRVKT
jgi:hypothetical protein